MVLEHLGVGGAPPYNHVLYVESVRQLELARKNEGGDMIIWISVECDKNKEGAVRSAVRAVGGRVA